MFIKKTADLAVSWLANNRLVNYRKKLLISNGEFFAYVIITISKGGAKNERK